MTLARSPSSSAWGSTGSALGLTEAAGVPSMAVGPTEGDAQSHRMMG